MVIRIQKQQYEGGTSQKVPSSFYRCLMEIVRWLWNPVLSRLEFVEFFLFPPGAYAVRWDPLRQQWARVPYFCLTRSRQE